MTAGQPDAVVYPNSTAEVAQIAALCAQHGVPIVAWGAGTSLEGHALAVKGGVTVDFRDMNRVIAVHPEDMLCTVQPGLTRMALNHALRDTGLFFPVDPGADASLGGMASTRASTCASASGASQGTTWRCGMLRSQVIWRLASWRVAAMPRSRSAGMGQLPSSDSQAWR
eukprot:gene52861-biopygen42564